MAYNPKVHHRRSIRLAHFDYSLPGAYFVTICSYGKQCIFGSVVGEQMRENDNGRIVREQWFDTVRIRPQMELDAFIVMPTHMHGILWILGPKGEHILWDSGYVIPDLVGPNSVGPGPNAVRPYVHGASQPKTGPANPIPSMRPRSLASWASGFKSAVTSRIRKLWNNPSAAVWQEDYFERIIRDEEELLNIREYILSNPLRWKMDRENPERAPDAEDDMPWDRDDELDSES